MADHDIVLDPNFFLPPGVVDMRYKILDRTGEDISVVNYDTTDPSYNDDDYQNPDDTFDPAIPIPNNVTVISQTVRGAPGAGQTVDVVIEVEDISGVSEIGVRLTKV